MALPRCRVVLIASELCMSTSLLWITVCTAQYIVCSPVRSMSTLLALAHDCTRHEIGWTPLPWWMVLGVTALAHLSSVYWFPGFSVSMQYNCRCSYVVLWRHLRQTNCGIHIPLGYLTLIKWQKILKWLGGSCSSATWLTANGHEQLYQLEWFAALHAASVWLGAKMDWKMMVVIRKSENIMLVAWSLPWASKVDVKLYIL